MKQNKKTIMFYFFTIVAITLLLFFKNSSPQGVTNINISQLNDMLSQNYQFVDVRTKGEYIGETGAKHIEKFNINLDYYTFQYNHSLLDVLDKNKPVVIICRSGNRSLKAAELLVSLGFKEVYNVEGGMNAWTSQ